MIDKHLFRIKTIQKRNIKKLPLVTLETIIKGCTKNKPKYQKALFDRYSEQMKMICIRYLYNDSDAQDALQEGFIKIFKSVKQYDNTGHFEAWMTRIFINTAISMIRKTKNLNEVFTNLEDDKFHPIESMEYKESRDILELNAASFDFDLALEAEFTQDELLECINLLELQFKLVFNLYFIEGYKHKEIATILNINEKTSRTRLMRSRTKIQNELYKMTVQRLAV